MTLRFSSSFFLFLFLVLSFQFLLTPRPLDAALVPCGLSEDDESTPGFYENAPCTVCHLVLGSENLIQWGLKVMTFIAVAVIVAMAILYIVSAGDEGLMGTAKNGIKASLIGFAVMLGAWLIVNLVITTLADTKNGSKPLAGLIKQGAFQFTCDTASNAGTASGITNNPGTYTSGGGAPTGLSGTGASGTGGGAKACEEINTAKQRLSSGGTVCNNAGRCPSCNTTAFDHLIVQYANQHGISPGFVRGLIARESSCLPGAERTESAGRGKSCGLMMVNTGSSSFSCDQLKDPETGIKEGMRILADAFRTAQNLKSGYGNTVTVEELAAAIHNAGAGQSGTSVDCTPASGWPTIPKWGCPINPGSAQFNACAIRDYACNVGACR